MVEKLYSWGRGINWELLQKQLQFFSEKGQYETFDSHYFETTKNAKPISTNTEE